MEETRIIKEITVIREGFLAMTPFRYTLEEWQLTKAGRKGKKAEMKRLKQMKKDKESRQPNKHEQQKESRDTETTLPDEDEDFVAGFCSGLIQEAVNEINEDEREDSFVVQFCRGLIEEAIYELSEEKPCESDNKDDIIFNFEAEIKAKIEKGEGDIGRVPTPADLFREERNYKLEAVDSEEDVQAANKQMSGDVEGEPAQLTKISLDDEELNKTGNDRTAADETLKRIDSEKDIKTKSKKDAIDEKKRQEKERKERKRIEEEQIKATKKYLKMVDEAMKDRTKVFKLFWEKTVEEQRRQEKKREKEQRKAQKAQEKKKLKESKSKLVKENGNNNHMSNYQDGGLQITEQQTKQKRTFGSRVLRFFGGLYGELVF